MNQKDEFKKLQQHHAEISKIWGRLSGNDIPTVPDIPEPPPVHIPPGQKMKVLVTFIGLSHTWVPPIDVMINGEWFHFYRRPQNSSLWNQELYGTRGQIIEVNGPIRNVRFKYDQIYDSNHKVFNYKLGAVFPNVDMSIQVDNDPESPNYYVNWFRIYDSTYPDGFIELADHVSAKGVLSGKKIIPFYEYNDIPESWSQTNQFRIIVSR